MHQTVRFLSNNSRHAASKLAALAESEESIISESSYRRNAQSSGFNDEHVCMMIKFFQCAHNLPFVNKFHSKIDLKNS